jgi:hypothetical protein
MCCAHVKVLGSLIGLSWLKGDMRRVTHSSLLPSAVQVGSLQQLDLRNYIARWERPDASVFGVAGAAELKSLRAPLSRLQVLVLPVSGNAAASDMRIAIARACILKLPASWVRDRNVGECDAGVAKQ